VDVYDSEYRRQSCRERIDRISDDYRRVQRQSKDSQRSVIAQARSVWQRVRRQVPQRVPVYRS
jgi:hemerythrin-like domain-containing protein